MARAPLLAASVLLFTCLLTITAHADTPKCQAIELHGLEAYDALVCSGIASMEKQDFKNAIHSLEAAAQTLLHEFPNFKLLPRLALAYLGAGDRQKAVQTLRQAELSLMVWTRLIRCDENGQLVRPGWGAAHKVDSPHHDDAASLMCGAAYDYLYHPNKLDEIADDGVLVDNFLKAKAAIEGNSSKK